jgi:hypothetical protein
MPSIQNILETVAGDSSPDIQFPVTRENGTIVDLTNAVVRLRIQDPVTGGRTNDASNLCTVLNGPAGLCNYSWNLAGTDCPDPGIYKADLVIVFPSTKKETYQFRIQAEPHV